VVDATAQIGEGAAVGAGCYIGPGVVIGSYSRLYSNVTVLDESRIGSGTIIWPGTVIRERCQVGNHCVVHANVSIGADGFGFRPSADGKSLVKIPQIGTVAIGNDVEIGAGSCIDRGKFGATVIGDGTKIDNLVQIGHNCRIGRCCVMAGQSGLAGSVTLGDGVVIGGGAKVSDHVTIGNGSTLGGNAGVFKDVAPGKALLGIPADEVRQTLKIWAAQKHIPELVRQWKKGDRRSPN
jgi:UDP-3-O-[3-hydroxymyristoyl] glucosamine N-acyltransferase